MNVRWQTFESGARSKKSSTRFHEFSVESVDLFNINLCSKAYTYNYVYRPAILCKFMSEYVQNIEDLEGNLSTPTFEITTS